MLLFFLTKDPSLFSYMYYEDYDYISWEDTSRNMFTFQERRSSPSYESVHLIIKVCYRLSTVLHIFFRTTRRRLLSTVRSSSPVLHFLFLTVSSWPPASCPPTLDLALLTPYSWPSTLDVLLLLLLLTSCRVKFYSSDKCRSIAVSVYFSKV